MKKNLFLLIGSIAVAWGLAEVILRAIGFSYPSFYQYDIHTGAALRPGAQGWWQEEGRSFVRINAQGMRDDRDIQVKKPKNVYRIAVLGDSYVEALQIDVSKSFWRLLEKKLNACNFGRGKRVEVLGFGVSGYSTAQELIMLRTRVAPFHPDMVILAFLSGNDVRDNSKEIARRYPCPFFVLQNGKLVEDTSFRESWIFKLKSSWLWQTMQTLSNYSRVVQLLNKVRHVLGQPLSAPRTEGGREDIGLDDHVYLSNPPPVWERAWEVTEALVVAMKNEAQRMGARFLLVTLTNPGQVYPDPEVVRRHAARLGEKDLFYPERRMRALAQRAGIDAVFLAEPFAEYAWKHKVFLHGFPNTVMGGGHWNERGHALAAELIAKHLCSGT